MIHYTVEGHIATLTLDHPSKSANVINKAFGDRLNALLDTIKGDPDIQGIILTSAKKTFLAGGDLDYLFSLRHNPQAVFEESEQLKALFRKLETIGIPVVAALNGSAMGGGYELALSCHHRIALKHPKLRIGMPEVTLGLLPGAGGVTKLVRLLGLQAALPYLMEGKRVNVQRAIQAGMIDALAETEAEMFQKAISWIEANPRPMQAWDKKGYKLPGGDPRHPRVAQMLAIAPAMLNKKTRGNYPAPQAILNTAVEGAMVDFDTACRIESRYFTQLLCGTVAENMIRVFWQQLNAINAGKSRPQNFPPYITRKVGILGAGMMGAGIAYASAAAGMEVVLKDVSMEMAEKGKAYSEKLLDKQLKRGRILPEKKTELLSRIHPTADAEDLRNCDLIIEAVFEDRKLKARVTREAEAQIPETATFASNTSTLPITGLAGASTRPEQFIGLHFFSPVDKMRLVEVICGEQSSDHTLARAFDYVLQIGKTPIVVNDSRGFYTSRVFATYILEALTLLSEGQHPQAIESAGLQAGMPVAPLALTDEVSLSLIYSIREQTRRDFEAEGKPYIKQAYHLILQQMVETFGRTGKKSGKGFYDYPDKGKKHLWKELTVHFPTGGTSLSQSEMMDRLLFVQALETVRCLEEGVLRSVADANIGSIFGWGFAPFHGGTLQFINAYGLPAFAIRAKELAEAYGERFQPPPLLEKMAENGETFSI